LTKKLTTKLTKNLTKKFSRLATQAGQHLEARTIERPCVASATMVRWLGKVCIEVFRLR